MIQLNFKQEISKITENQEGEIINYADGYSLGVNNATGLLLISGDFEDVRGFNGAPINAYNLANSDSSFEDFLRGTGA